MKSEVENIEQRSHMEGTMPRLDVEVRGGGGAVERLHASCHHAAVEEVERGKRGQVAHCSQPLGRHLDAATAIQRH